MERILRHLGLWGQAKARGPPDKPPNPKPTERRVFRLTKVEGNSHMTVDLVLVNPLLEDVWAAREKHLVEGKTLRVVSREGLGKMKRLAGRPQDLADLSQLGLEPGGGDDEP